MFKPIFSLFCILFNYGRTVTFCINNQCDSNSFTNQKNKTQMRISNNEFRKNVAKKVIIRKKNEKEKIKSKNEENCDERFQKRLEIK